MAASVDPALLERVWHAQAAGRVDAAGFPELDVDTGQALQVAILRRHAAEGRAVGGWKVGLTSGAGRDSFGAGVRPFGFVLANRVFRSPAELTLSTIVTAGVENELCFVMDTALGKGATAAAARRAVRGVAPAFEINQLRLRGRASPGLAVAENLSQWGIVVGAAVAVAKVDFDAINVTLACDETTVETVAARGHIDNHFESLAVLANRLAQFGLALEAGHHVITGSFTRQSVPGPSRWTGEFGAPLGTVRVAFLQ